MSGDDVRTHVIRILAEQALLEPRDVEDARTLQDIGIDSLGLVESIFAIEETFDVSVPFNANDPEASAAEFDISTIANIVTAVEKLVAAKPE